MTLSSLGVGALPAPARSASAGALVKIPSDGTCVPGHPGKCERRRARPRGRLRVQRAEAEHADAVVAVVAPLLHDGERAAHRLADANGDRILHGAEAVEQGARRQLLPHLGFGGLRRRHDRDEGESIGVVERTVAHAEVVDGNEDPATGRMPGGLRAPLAGPGRSSVK